MCKSVHHLLNFCPLSFKILQIVYEMYIFLVLFSFTASYPCSKAQCKPHRGWQMSLPCHPWNKRKKINWQNCIFPSLIPSSKVHLTFLGDINQNILPSLVIATKWKRLGPTWPTTHSQLSACLLGRSQDQGPWTRGSCPYIAGSWLLFIVSYLFSFWISPQRRPLSTESACQGHLKNKLYLDWQYQCHHLSSLSLSMSWS